ncbi:unnamed protein product [Bemisia tabaci]|uniref:Osiris 18 n=1 Tax=Bemisia tabaci TaxID=7038 RepID=A0A9P0F9H6_BEMTA|nr:unnamed protein product [Bemisia tabaci]
MSTPLLFALAASACFLAIACDTVLPDVTHPGHRVTDTEERPVQEESHADSDGNDFTHVVEDVTHVVEDVTHADSDASHADSDATTENDYQDLFKVLNMGIANTLRGMRRAPFYNLAPNMFLVRNNLSNKGMNEGIEGEPVTRVVSLVQLAKSADALFESHSLYCLLSDKTGLQIARAPGNGELGVRIKKIDDRFENEIQEGRGRHDIAFLPIMYAMGVIMTMLGVITFLTIKSITIGVILLVVAYTYTLGKLKHHKKFLYHYPEHYHHHHPHPPHHHKAYAIDVLQHDILHDYEHEFPLSPHAHETAYHVDAASASAYEPQVAASSPAQDTRKAYSQAGWAYVLVDKVPQKMSQFTQKRGVVAKKKRKVSHIEKKLSSLG